MMNSKSLNDDYFIKNAILCWLHHYPNHKWTGIYEELAKRDSYTSKSESEPVSKPASRKRSRGRSTPKSSDDSKTNPTES